MTRKKSPLRAKCLFKWFTAFHFQEESQTTWFKRSLEDKVAWYYDKTHTLIQTTSLRFNTFLHLQTKYLSSRETLDSLTHFIDEDWNSPPLKKRYLKANILNLNALASLTIQEKSSIHAFYANFDFLLAGPNPLVGDEFFWQRIYMALSQMPNAQAKSILQEYQQLLLQRARDLEALKRKKGG